MAAAEIEPSFVRQDAVCFGNRVVVHSQIDGHASHGGERPAYGKNTVHQQCSNGIRDLAIRRHRGSEIDANDGRRFHCMMSTDNRQCGAEMSSATLMSEWVGLGAK